MKNQTILNYKKKKSFTIFLILDFSFYLVDILIHSQKHLIWGSTRQLEDINIFEASDNFLYDGSNSK